ncbi:formylglycine-generating enzyme family protein [Bradyrhizobium sp. MOS002]|uniref:formylglycine-generating enzyme family protein n=1 Tax=Bradyrhizobium sp. MOS002 TaxID=2133947 RepID=UPI000D126867|nr:formylglycine-generating enzyme family protein [Bradyrhizobium sp. MOS002]PSO19953.1 formylglycine-generating enzyme family protein [Bradyrhizobium sp. MOS002]
MNKFAYRLPLLLAPLIIELQVASVGAETLDQSVPALSTLERSSPLDLRLSGPLSRSEESALVPSDRFKECDLCPVMIVVPAGRFTMGASADEPGSTADERPQHQVIFPSFSVGRFPVSLDEWNVCVMRKGCSYRASDPISSSEWKPVTNIQWAEAKEYVDWLSRSTGKPYRLLSESEREYVARAGTTTAFWWGDSFAPDRIEERQGAGTNSLPSRPSLPNPWGFYEIHGNVYDWVEDCWHDNYQGAPADGSAWIEGDCSRHVLRGGSPSRAVQTRRAAARIWFGPSNRMQYMSVRVARTLQ